METKRGGALGVPAFLPQGVLTLLSGGGFTATHVCKFSCTLWCGAAETGGLWSSETQQLKDLLSEL